MNSLHTEVTIWWTFIQDINITEEIYAGLWGTHMMEAYCWSKRKHGLDMKSSGITH